MGQIFAIALGGAAGAVLRYWTSLGVHGVLGREFPYGTLVINVLGSLLMGLLAVVMLERFDIAPQWRAGVLIGLLGAYTTFSAFSLETLNLIEQGDAIKAMLNIGLSVLLCVGATWAGLLIGRQL